MKEQFKKFKISLSLHERQQRVIDHQAAVVLCNSVICFNLLFKICSLSRNF